MWCKWIEHGIKYERISRLGFVVYLPPVRDSWWRSLSVLAFPAQSALCLERFYVIAAPIPTTSFLFDGFLFSWTNRELSMTVQKERKKLMNGRVTKKKWRENGDENHFNMHNPNGIEVALVLCWIISFIYRKMPTQGISAQQSSERSCHYVRTVFSTRFCVWMQYYTATGGYTPFFVRF